MTISKSYTFRRKTYHPRDNRQVFSECTKLLPVNWKTKGRPQTHESAAKVIFGSDAESDAWESIYSASDNNDNLDKLKFDAFKISHHCSNDALNKDEKGDETTEPVEKVKKLFEEHGNDKYKLIASCEKIPSKAKRNESGPPHYQAAEYYRKVAGDKNGDFQVTMEQKLKGKKRKPIIIEITKHGPKLLTVIGSTGSAVVTSQRTERFG